MSDERAGWAEVVRRQGGLAARALREVGESELAAAALLGIVVADQPHTPALARLSPPQAVGALLLSEAAGSAADLGKPANELLAKLEAAALPCFLLNDGQIGGPDGEPGVIRLSRKEADELLGAAMSRQLEWERDPDFGYEVPLASPSFAAERALALAPRLAYAAHGRVYDHASLVPQLKEERHSRLAAVPGLDAAIVATAGWPVEPTGSSWRPGI